MSKQGTNWATSRKYERSQIGMQCMEIIVQSHCVGKYVEPRPTVEAGKGKEMEKTTSGKMK